MYRDDTAQFIKIKEEIGYNTKPKTTDKEEEDVDSPAEIAEKIQEAIGVFMDDEPERR